MDSIHPCHNECLIAGNFDYFVHGPSGIIKTIERQKKNFPKWTVSPQILELITNEISVGKWVENVTNFFCDANLMSIAEATHWKKVKEKKHQQQQQNEVLNSRSAKWVRYG